MTLHVGESGKDIGLNLSFDISSFTLLEIVLTDPQGLSTTIDSSDRVTAPSSGATFTTTSNGVESSATYAANQYMQFTCIASDFDSAGTWSMVGRYTNTAANPDDIYESKPVQFRVYPAAG